jgi:hypothetical protein
MLAILSHLPIFADPDDMLWKVTRLLRPNGLRFSRSRRVLPLMKFDNQHRQSRSEALAGDDRLKARLQRAITGFERQISLERDSAKIAPIL